ncbi:hypothetical protein D9615_003689 [Tricholomella constricta]|uniref:RhoGAP-domain-containing protein n=1 Tax=Tricholomella constricta TaxID=117010 RepID=A0A8H5HIS4_9AGAR|nr:hypothetical protein D9615_003689 [Tricholomella constricta]
MSLSAANGSSSIYGTPSRSERLPFPQSSNPSPAHTPQRQPTASAASTSHSASFSTVTTPSSSAPPVNKDRLLTSASLLKANAAAQDPKLAALEQAVNDRNVLSSQNAQLWKLIEKQRTGYNQILKELERVRGERDAYKAKLGGSGGSDRRHRGGDPKRSFSENTSPASENTTSSNGDPRQAVSRHYSDDQPTPRSVHHPQLHSSRSYEPLSARDNSLQANANYVTINPQTANSTPNVRSAKPSPTPLIVPPRAENLPVPASAISATQEANPFGHHAQHVPDFSPPDPGSLSNGDSPTTRPLATYPRKSSLADSVNSVVSTSTGSSSHISSSASSNVNYGPPSSTSSPYTPASQQYHYNGGLTPQTAPAGFGGPPSDPNQTISRTATIPAIQSQAYPQILTTPSTSSQPNLISSASISNGMLSTIPEARPHALSRDSRISLPDEARQYIANMTDSPIPSPRVDAFAARPSASSRMLQPQIRIPDKPGGLAPPSAASLGEADSPGGSSEFLDMNEDEEDDDEADDEQSAAPDEITDDTSLQDTPRRPIQAVPQLDTPQLQAHGRKLKPRVEVDLFPLPPPNAPLQPQHAMSQSQMFASQASAEAAHQQHMSSAPAPYASTEHISPLENPYSPAGQSQQQPQQSMQSLRLDQKQPQQPMVQTVPANFRALPLLSSDLPHTTITVSHSFVRPNDRGKEVLSFVVFVDPGKGKEGWRVEKMYSDVLGLDQRIRNAVGKSMGKRIASLPEGKLWRDHAPAKVDQRKAVLENYLQMLINLPVKENNEVIAFFTSDIVRETKQPVMQVGHKEGYLTKRGKNFGGWKTRYFVLQGPILEYYDCRGGAHLGSILITGAQIGRQQRSERAPSADEEKEYRHAFLIVEAKKGPGGNHPRHVLCAESDDDRDAWVEILVRYFSGTYSEEPIKYGPAPVAANALAYQNSVASQPRSSISSTAESPTTRRPTRGFSKDDISISRGAAVPISQLPPDQANPKLFPPAGLVVDDYGRSSSPSKHAESPIDPQNATARRIMERGQGQPSSLPDSSPLSSVSNFHSDSSFGTSQRANSELGHYPDLSGRSNRQVSPERHRIRDPHEKHKSFHPTLNTVVSSPTQPLPLDRVPSPDKLEANGKVKISGPLNGAPIPSGFKFGGKDAPPASESTAADRRLKSRSFWGFGKPNGDKSSQPVATYIPRAVFGVTLEDSLEVAQIANLPAIVFRSIQYLESKKADQEEGIYRLSGSSAVIKSLKDRFNMEGDVDLLASDEYWDPHAIAGLLKSFLRELPASILTRDLHLKFLAVIDFVDAQERIKELSQLIASLPLANYSLLRALTAHLILIVQNSSVNKMTMRNVGIVFSPTLGIPAGVFSLMLGEFNRVFNVDAGTEEAASRAENSEDDGSDLDRRNSKHYSDAAADQLLGLTGRTLKTLAQEAPSDGDDLSVQDESGTETTDGDFTLESSSECSPGSTSLQADGTIRLTPPDTPVASKAKASRASNLAATRGLNVSVTGSERGNRHSRMIGLPTSPRPSQTSSPSRPPDVPPSPSYPQRD